MKFQQQEIDLLSVVQVISILIKNNFWSGLCTLPSADESFYFGDFSKKRQF